MRGSYLRPRKGKARHAPLELLSRLCKVGAGKGGRMQTNRRKFVGLAAVATLAWCVPSSSPRKAPPRR